MFRYYKLLQQTSYSPPQQTLVYKKEEISREEAIRLLSEQKLQHIEEDLRQSALSAPQFSISAQIHIKYIDENIAEYIVITYYPLDLLIEKLQSVFPKSRLPEKLPIILSASHLTVIDKKRYIQLVAYMEGKKIPILTTTKKDTMPVLRALVKLHKEYKS